MQLIKCATDWLVIVIGVYVFEKLKSCLAAMLALISLGKILEFLIKKMVMAYNLGLQYVHFICCINIAYIRYIGIFHYTISIIFFISTLIIMASVQIYILVSFLQKSSKYFLLYLALVPKSIFLLFLFHHYLYSQKVSYANNLLMSSLY